MGQCEATRKVLLEELADLRSRLEESEEILKAICQADLFLEIEQACPDHVFSLALACGQHPATCVSSMQDEIPSLFRDVSLSVRK